MELAVTEFYSGIGGYHMALSQLGVPFSVVQAFDLSHVPNMVYRRNFPDTKLQEKNLCGITAKDLMRYPSNCYLMSPPCQPHTRQGNQKDENDPRSESIYHLFDVISQLPPEHVPQYMFVENVKGFENSNTRHMIISFLRSHHFYFREFLLNSSQFNIPNSRLRYYLVARRTRPFPTTSSSSESSFIETELPFPSSLLPPRPSLSSFLEEEGKEEEETSSYSIPDNYLSKWGKLLDIVTPQSQRSCCFTKGYSVKAEGSGSVLQCKNVELELRSDRTTEGLSPDHPLDDEDNKNNQNSLSDSLLTGQEFLRHMKSLKLRYFTPREIARIHGIPDTFSFPANLTRKQLYRVLGNGLNVTVVKYLLQYVLFNENYP